MKWNNNFWVTCVCEWNVERERSSTVESIKDQTVTTMYECSGKNTWLDCDRVKGSIDSHTMYIYTGWHTMYLLYIYIYSKSMYITLSIFTALILHKWSLARATTNTTRWFRSVWFRGGTNSRVATADARPRFWCKLSIGMKMFYSRESTKIPRLGTAAPLSMFDVSSCVCSNRIGTERPINIIYIVSLIYHSPTQANTHSSLLYPPTEVVAIRGRIESTTW